VRETPGAVSVISEADIQEQLMQDIGDLVKFEPGVYVEGDLLRLGLNGFNIRGIGGNRVLTRVDGVAAGESFVFGPLAAPAYALDLEVLKSVEILRSAGSALYGSDALGGVVSLLTKDPDDYLSAVDGRFFLDGNAGYASRSEEQSESLSAALGNERWAGSVFAVRRDGGELDNQGERSTEDPTRTAPNPQDSATRNGLAKLRYAPNASLSFKLTGEAYRSRTATELFTGRSFTNMGGNLPPGSTFTINVADSDALDRQRRDRFSLEGHSERSGLLSDRLRARIDYQDNETDQTTVESRITTLGGGVLGPVNVTRVSRRGVLTFEQRGLGGELEFEKGWIGGRATHLFTYGGAYHRDRFDQVRDRRDRSLDTGNPDVYPGPLVFPTKYFPRSDVDEGGVFVQDQVALAGGRVALVPGVRFDRYALRPEKGDPAYLAGNAGIAPPVDKTSSIVSPRFGVVGALTPHLALSGQYARGFRAPSFDAVNNGFTNLASGYTTLPNPDLEPETSRNLEIGLRGHWTRGRFSLAAFRNRYSDFIENVTVGVNPQTGLIEFQNQNVGAARIEGIELAGEAALGRGWNLRAAAASIEGDNATTGQPLNSVAPRSLALGVRYAETQGRWGGELSGVRTASKGAGDVDSTTVRQFIPPASTVVDLTGFWRITPRLSLNAGVFNLLDETYWSWGDVLGRAATSTVLDRYTRPGRNVSVALRLRR
jgi:hemoglobin/transferrin/lactoferrin receptor protein